MLAVVLAGCGAGFDDSGEEDRADGSRTWHRASSVPVLSGGTRQAQWFTGPGEETAGGVAHDGDGHRLVAANFQGRLSDSVGRFGTSTTRACALTKYRPDGQRVWTRIVPAPVSALTTNRERHVLITGVFEGSIDLGGGPLTAGDFLTGLFFAEFDAAGNHVWSRAYPLEFFSFFGARALVTDGEGNIAVAGLLRGGIYFDKRYVVADSAPVLLRLSPEGRFQWSYVEQPSFGESGGVAVDEDDHLYMAGTLLTDLYPPLDRIPFVNRLSPTGVRRWQRRVDTVNGQGQGVAVHGNRVVLTGSFLAPLRFAGQTFRPVHAQDGFVVAYTRSGDERWGRQLGLEGLDVAMDHRDDLVVVGRYQHGDDLGRGPVEGSPGSDTNLFAAKFDRIDGTLRWTRGFAMAHPTGVSTFGDRYRVSVDEQGGTALLGGLIAPLDAGPRTLAPTDVRDLFLLDLKP
nr:hypothetical protein [Corallococcus terminator]